MNSFVDKYKNHPAAKYIKYVAILFIIFISYEIYVWANTQSTDNAYIESDISNVSCEISGVVKNVLVTNNVEVKQGDLIAELNEDNFKAEYIKVCADVNSGIQKVKIAEQEMLVGQINLEKAKEGLRLSQTNFDLSTIDYQRIVELNKDKFASQKLLDEGKNKFENAKSEYKQAQLNLEESEHNLVSLREKKFLTEAELQSLKQAKYLAERDLNNTKIKAPISGRIANNNLKVGNYVRPGVLLFSIVPDNCYVKANFKETQVEKFKEGMKVLLKFDSLPNLKIPGNIRNISPATGAKFSLIPPDNSTGNFTKIVQRVPILIDFEVPKIPNLNLVPGMSVVVSIRTDK